MSNTGRSDFPVLTPESVVAGGIDELIDAVCRHLNYVGNISWSWKVHGQVFGRAFYGQKRIELNPIVISLSNGYDELTNTVIHEVCHIVAYAHHKDRGHGQAWKALMICCGVPPERCGMVTKDDRDRWNVNKHRRFSYICGSCGAPFSVTAVVHNRINRGVRYKTRCCGDKLVFASSRGTKNDGSAST